MAIADLQGVLDHALGVIGRHLEDAEPELRDVDAVVELDAGDGGD
jgi:hypothetical protein